MEDYFENYLKVKERTDRYLISKYDNKASLDGIINPFLYFTPDRDRIVFITKETYAKKDETAWSPVYDAYNKDFIPQNTCLPLTRIRRNFSDLLVDENGHVSGFGYFNISKSAMEIVDNDTSSNLTLLKRAYRENKDIFWESFHASMSDFAVFCGTFGIVWKDLLEQFGDYFFPVRFTQNLALNNFKEKELSVWKMKGRDYPVLIQTYHPSFGGNVFDRIPEVIHEVQKGAYFLEEYKIKGKKSC